MPDRPLLHGVLDLLPDGANMVETGVQRQPITEGCDGASTAIFLGWITHHGGTLTSIDISAENCAFAKGLFGAWRNWHLLCGDAAQVITVYPQFINLLYLDSHDYDPADPQPAQNQCRQEYLAARHLLTAGSYLLVDDADLPGGGKPGLLEPLLAEDGWELIGSDYQKLWTKH